MASNNGGLLGRLTAARKAIMGGLTERLLRPDTVASRAQPDRVAQDFLRQNPAAYGLDVRAVRSSSNAHGYLMLANEGLYNLLDDMYGRDLVISSSVDLVAGHLLMRESGLALPEAAKNDARAKAIHRFVQDRILNDSHFQYLKWSLAHGVIRHGRSTVEVCWKADDDGRYVPSAYYHAHPGQFAYDRDGNTYLWKGGTGGEVPVPKYKFISASTPALYDNPWGEPLLFRLRHLWHYKRKVLMALVRFAEKYGTPLIHGKLPRDVANVDGLKRALEESLKRLQDDDALVTAAGEEIEIHLRSGGAGRGNSLHSEIVAIIDSYFVRAILGAELATVAGERGARSLGEVHERTILKRVLPYARLVEDAINDCLIRPAVEMNFPPETWELTPRYEIDTEEAVDAETARENLKVLKALGVTVAVDQVRKWMGARVPLEDEDVVTVGDLGIRPDGELTVAPKVPVEPATKTAAEVEGEEEESPPPAKKKQPVAASETEVVAVPFASGGHEYGCLMYRLPDESAAMVQQWIGEHVHPDDLAGDGAATEPHLTILYGVHKGVKPQQVIDAVCACWPPLLLYGGLSVFEGKEHDVLYVSVDPGYGLSELREAAEGVEHTKTHPTYTPHITLAFLKKGRGASYVQSALDAQWNGPLDGWMDIADRLVYSAPDGTRTEFSLTGPFVTMGAPGWFNAPREYRYRSSLWSSKGKGGQLLRFSSKRAAARAAEDATDALERLAAAAAADARPGLVKAWQRTGDNLRTMFAPDEPLNQRAVSYVDTRDLDAPMAEALQRVGLCSALLSIYVTHEAKAYIQSAKQKFADGESGEVDWLDKLPEGFRTAAQWMASRGVMTVEMVRKLAEAMSVEFGMSVEVIERQLREQYLALAGTASTAATRKVQAVIADAVARGKTVAEFLEEMDRLFGMGDVPGGMDGYWNMVFRTEVGNAYRQQQEEHELILGDYLWGWEVYNPRDARSRPSHAALSGKRFKKGSSAAELLGKPPWAYQCFLPGTVVEGSFDTVLRSLYSGEAVEISTGSGARLSVTANHPVLTTKGLVAAKDLDESHELIRYVGRVEAAPPAGENEHDGPATVEEVMQALRLMSPAFRTKVGPDDLHGEAQFTTGEVEVVTTNGKLRSALETAGEQGLHEFLLSRVNVAQGALPLQPLRFGSASLLDLPALQNPGNGGTVGESHQHGLPADLLACYLVARGDGQFVTERLASLRRFRYSGYVYDLQSVTGHLVAGGLCVSNCRCSMIPLVAPDPANVEYTESKEAAELATRTERFSE